MRVLYVASSLLEPSALLAGANRARRDDLRLLDRLSASDSQCRHGVQGALVGALLVVSAAMARNSDRASLIDEPWRLLGPFAASLAISGALFLTIYGLARWKGMASPGIGRAYFSFLALYWMTAPLAWLYAIPYERFLSPLGATKANVWTLALVSEGGIGALAFAGLTVVGWTAVVPFTQPDQMLAHRVERAYRTSGPAAALAMMSAHERINFPPDWQPPPRQFPGEPPLSEVLDMLEAVADRPHAGWIDEVYSRQFQDRVVQDEYAWPEQLLSEHSIRLAAILPRLPRGPEMARAFQHPIPSIDLVLKGDTLGPQFRLTQAQRSALETLLRLAGEGKDLR